jgi:hypothetical protein
VNVLNFFNSRNSSTTTIFTSEVQGNVEARNSTVGDFDLGWVDLDLTQGAGTLGATCAANSNIGESCMTYPPTSGQGANAVTRYSLGLPAISIMFTEFDGGKTSLTVPVSYSNAISAGNGYIVTP